MRNELKTELDAMKALIRAKDDQIDNLQKRIAQLETNQDEAEQYSRRNSVRIARLQEEPSEDIENKVITFLRESLSTRIELTEICRTHRVGRKTTDHGSSRDSPPHAILVKFTSYRCKARVMKARSRLKDKSFNGRSVYIN